MKSTSGRTRRTGTAAIAENADPARAEAAIRRVVELSGGMDWLKPGASVVIKPALNSSHAFPFTASPASCAALVRMCLERGAKQVWVADETGFEHTMLKHWKTGHFAGFEKDHTIKSFKKTGIYDAVRAVGDELGATDRIHITTFREHGWRRHALSTSRKESGGFALHNEWVREQLKGAEKLGGGQARRRYLPRLFDRTPGGSKAGLWVPSLLDEADHIINVFRISTHVWSQFTMAIKNWVGIMRPDDRVWMHQLNYLKNNRHSRHGLGWDHPIRSEPLYHEQLAELHIAHAHKERLCVADATQVIVTGGPDGTDRPLCRANLVLAATDIVAADVAALAILRWGTMKAPDGLHGRYEPQPSGWLEAASGLIKDLRWPKGKHVFRGTDGKLCDPGFSNWDWVAIQRARELGLGVERPADLDLRFEAGSSRFAVSKEKRAWVAEDVSRGPRYDLK